MRRLGLLLALGSVVLMAACGSSNSGSVTSVTVSCSPTTVSSGGTSQCSATVNGTGSFNSAVNWSTSAGSISTSGTLTAPTVTATVSVTVTAASVQNSGITGSASVTVNPGSSNNNVQPITVDAGPEPNTFLATNIAYTTVTVCLPGSTTQCQSIDHVQVDTGSSGLRLLQGVLTINLPQESNSNNSPLDECLVFLDGFVWGPVATADVTMAGEKAGSVPVQIIIPSTSNPPVPSTCSSQTTGGNEGNSVEDLGANGLIGVGLFQQDCGPGCTSQNQNGPPAVYYGCPASGCNPTFISEQQQLTNPVALFPGDNNGVLIQLPSVPDGGSPTVSGSLIFGIGTQSNNGLNGATVYAVPDSGSNAGNITTTFNGTSYPDSFIDSGSNGLFFLNSSVPGVPATCTGQLNDWYCPSPSPDNLSAGNQGDNMSAPVTVNFSIENASQLFSGDNVAFSTLGGPNPNSFDWGLSFFYGRKVFTAIENMSTPGGQGPYFAY